MDVHHFIILSFFYHYIIIGDNNTDLTVHTPFVHLSPPFTTQEVSVTFNNDGVAFEGNETYQLCLIPTSSHNQTDVNFRDNITLTILDSDGKFHPLHVVAM